MKNSDVLKNHLIAFMEKDEHNNWDIKDTESRYIYANKAVYLNSCLSMNFKIEGLLETECPTSWKTYAGECSTYCKTVLESGYPIFNVATHRVGKERKIRSFLVEITPYYPQSKIEGVITRGTKISPVLLSKYFFNYFNSTSLLTNNPPNDLFKKQELDVLFFAMRLFSNKEIALILSISDCVVDQIIQQICNKIDIPKRKQLRDYGISNGFDNYFPPYLLKRLL